MPTAEIAVGAEEVSALHFPEDCTVGRWKQLMSEGFLGDRILYATKLSLLIEERGRPLEDAAPLPAPPARMFIAGPASVIRMLELALRKRLGSFRIDRLQQRLSPNRQESALAKEESTPWKHLYLEDERRQDFALQQKAMLAGGNVQRDLAGPSRAFAPAGSLAKAFGVDETMRFFCAGKQGMRPHMEDRTCGVLRLPGHEHAALFGVFDGHGGHEVSTLAVQLLPGILSAALKELTDPAEALRRSFKLLDEELRSLSREHPQSFDRIGSTAVVTLILREAGALRVVCANCGDSRAVLCRQGHAMDLSADHKPQNAEERQRIVAAGGRVELFGPCWRIDAGLNLSRALGDFAYKANPDKPPGEQKVTAEPELKEVVLDKDDQFLVMGSDGVFDVLTSEALVLHLRSVEQRQNSWASAIESALVRAVPGGDNVSVCFVEFRHA